MNLAERLISFLKRKEAPEGMCPNCWGREEYGGKFYDAVKNNHTEIHSSKPNVGWIQAYAEQHLSDIQLVKKDDDKAVCPKCKLTYVESKGE